MDECGQLRSMSVGDLMDMRQMAQVDANLTLIVEKAKRVVMMQHRLTVADVDYIMDRLGHSAYTALGEGKLKIVRTAETDVWPGRKVCWTTKDGDALSWLRYVFLRGYSKNHAYAWPIMICTNYACFSEALCAYLVKLLQHHAAEARWTPEDTAAACARIKVINAATKVGRDPFPKQFCSNPDAHQAEADVLIVTYAVQSGVSVNGHFRMLFAFLFAWVGTLDDAWQCVNRLRAALGLFTLSRFYLVSREGIH